MPGAVALRLDDVGASSKRFEVYGRTRLPFGGWQLPFPGNFLFLKYLPPLQRWGPHGELVPLDQQDRSRWLSRGPLDQVLRHAQ